MTLIEFLRAQLDADERVAMAASPGPWILAPEPYRQDADDMPISTAQGDVLCVSPDDHVRGGHRNVDAAHIVAWEPTRVLAEVKAKRAILDLYAKAIESRKLHPDDLSGAGSLLSLLAVVRLLAQPYAGRDGWQHEWSVTE